MARSDDIAPLFVPPPVVAVGMRQGVVEAWDSGTLANTVNVAGTSMTDLPVLRSADTALIGVGDAVVLLTYGASWLVLGRVTTP